MEDTEDANHTDVHPAHGATDEQEGMAERITRHHAVAIGDYIILLEATRADSTTPRDPYYPEPYGDRYDDYDRYRYR